MLQNNPMKSDIEQMNDWEAFKEHIQRSVDKQVVSNKTVIMILFIASSAFHLLTVTLALIAEENGGYTMNCIPINPVY